MAATTCDDVLQAALRLTPEEQARLRDELGHHEAAGPTTPASWANFITALQTAEPLDPAIVGGMERLIEAGCEQVDPHGW